MGDCYTGMKDRIRGALLGAMVGDALGRPFEGTPAGDLARLREAIGRRVNCPRAWGHTDDAEMTLSVAESLLTARGIDEGHVLEMLYANHDPARGYGKGTLASFRVWRESGSWERASRALWEEGSRGNGAAVRVAPVALYFRDAPLDAMLVAARRSAVPTHAHVEAIDGAAVIALATWFALREQEPGDVMAKVKEHAPGSFQELVSLALAMRTHGPDDAIRRLGHGVWAVESVPAALWAYARTSTFSEAVVEAVALGGDTDSIGAMTGAIAGATYGASAIPPAWFDALEEDSLRKAIRLADGFLRRAD
ncbi:MAG: ADP-ribosylglycohydrolase family protein, partial [Thermoanaerobaculia bacterium]